MWRALLALVFFSFVYPSALAADAVEEPCAPIAKIYSENPMSIYRVTLVACLKKSHPDLFAEVSEPEASKQITITGKTENSAFDLSNAVRNGQSSDADASYKRLQEACAKNPACGASGLGNLGSTASTAVEVPNAITE